MARLAGLIRELFFMRVFVAVIALFVVDRLETALSVALLAGRLYVLTIEPVPLILRGVVVKGG